MTLLDQVTDITMCPYCSNTDIEEIADCSPVDLHIKSQKVHCNNCNMEWFEEYKFTQRYDLDFHEL